MVGQLWTYRASFIEAVDGDTVKMELDHGMYIFSRQSIRLFGFDAPELFSGTSEERESGKLAKLKLFEWFATHTHGRLTGEWPFTLSTIKDRRSFNRYIGTVTCVQAHSINKDLGEL